MAEPNLTRPSDPKLFVLPIPNASSVGDANWAGVWVNFRNHLLSCRAVLHRAALVRFYMQLKQGWEKFLVWLESGPVVFRPLNFPFSSILMIYSFLCESMSPCFLHHPTQLHSPGSQPRRTSDKFSIKSDDLQTTGVGMSVCFAH